ncbi:hypothetical protein A1O1_04465 [Capronia coronata CBS 617.96]|uniref:Uncharacterized protein n=1 Tax=Capronia coronata CBS 617.96 TaxID=1182541 RepID=W9YFR7_9EURO|nr:uncharacterized protein A1O1_04465 [Capronia coronata CBS 617.96]EXJ91353.1 hypothetical protein A1O1_04465 [Capronia coronata CBS 617.96]
MADDNKENRIEMNENAENIPPEGSTEQKGGQGSGGGGGGGGDSGSWYSKPENFGNKAGDKVEGMLSPVGKYTGPALQKAGGPIGGLVDPTIGGVMRMGKGWGEQVGVGFGNHEGGPAKQEEAEAQRMKEPVGGKEQNAENPLGL